MTASRSSICDSSKCIVDFQAVPKTIAFKSYQRLCQNVAAIVAIALQTSIFLDAITMFARLEQKRK